MTMRIQVNSRKRDAHSLKTVLTIHIVTPVVTKNTTNTPPPPHHQATCAANELTCCGAKLTMMLGCRLQQLPCDNFSIIQTKAKRDATPHACMSASLAVCARAPSFERFGAGCCMQCIAMRGRVSAVRDG